MFLAPSNKYFADHKALRQATQQYALTLASWHGAPPRSGR